MSEIKVYARFRPLPPECHRIESLHTTSNVVNISTGNKDAEKFASSHYAEHSFRFKEVFDCNASQENIFESVAIEMIDRFLDGFNGTLFAYGQTASGKTYTIEGGARQYNERGLIPRVISYVYSALEARKEANKEIFTVNVSFLEIYQDTGFDLLNPGNRNEGMLLTLPKVSVSESPNGEVTVRHLSSHLACNEEVALSLLFQGSTCRKVAETSMNISSSRSHAIFTLTLTSQKEGSEVRTRSKLHLVDLAGSERVYKTGATDQILQEAKHINLSLHHLEHVIVILQKQCSRPQSVVTPSSSSERGLRSQQQSRGFVPYRNSLLTMVLKDSLGGNCITAMIANLSMDKKNVLETISTCRFAQRVACISNKAKRNEELDDKIVIKKLKERIRQLEEEIKSMKESNEATTWHKAHQSSPNYLSEQDKKKCHKILYNFLHGKVKNPVSEGINTTILFSECMMIMKDMVLHTIKETKRNKDTIVPVEQLQQNSVKKDLSPLQSSTDTCRSANPMSTSSKSVSPNSQVSSGFVSLRDEEARLTQVPCSRENHSINNLKTGKKTGHLKSEKSRVYEQINETEHRVKHKNECTARSLRHSRSSSRKSETEERGMLTSPDSRMNSVHSTKQTSPNGLLGFGPQSDPNTARTVNSSHITSQSKRKSLSPFESVSPETKLMQKQRSDLVSKVTNLSLQVQQDNLSYELQSVSNELSNQHRRVIELGQSGANIDDIIRERRVEQQLKIKQSRLSEKLTQIQYNLKLISISQPSPEREAIVQTASNAQNKLKDEIHELKLEQLQKQLELKEVATRKRLFALRQELEPVGSSQTEIDPSFLHAKPENWRHQLKANTDKLTKRTTEIKNLSERPNIKVESPSPFTNPPAALKTTVTSRENTQEQSTTTSSLTQTSERLYTQALNKHKARVNQIRQCIKAAVTIQRAWRKYKAGRIDVHNSYTKNEYSC